MKPLLVILLGLFGFWHLIDLSSNSFLQSVFAPFIFFLLLVALFIWLVLKTGSDNRGGSIDSGVGWDSSDYGDSGDGGGGD